MKVTGTSSNLFTSNYNNNTKKTNVSNGFTSALQEQYANNMGNTTKSAQTANSEMVKTIIEEIQTENPKLLSDTQIEYLQNRYDVKDLEVTCSESGVHCFSEEHDNFINDLYEWGILSEKDMETFQNKFLEPYTGTVGIITKIDNNSPLYRRFFHVGLNPEWGKDITNYYRAMADKHLEISKWLEERKNRPVDPAISAHIAPDGWYEKSAEVKNRFADILDQIFKN